MLCGPDATYDATIGKQSVIGNGIALCDCLIRKTCAKYFNAELLENVRDTAKRSWIMLSFSENPAATITVGKLDNALDNRTDDIWLNVTPSVTTDVNCVQTIALASFAASGSYVMTYKCQISSSLPYSATVAQMKQALESISTAIAYMFDVTFNNTFSASTTVTFSFNNYRPVNAIGVIPLALESSGDVLITPPVSITTAGQYGITVGQYDVRVMAWCYSELVVKSGDIKTL